MMTIYILPIRSRVCQDCSEYISKSFCVIFIYNKEIFPQNDTSLYVLFFISELFLVLETE